MFRLTDRSIWLTIDDVQSKSSFDLVREKPPKRLDCEVLLLGLSDLCQKFIGKNGQVRLAETGGLEYVQNAVRHHGARQQLADVPFDTLPATSLIQPCT